MRVNLREFFGRRLKQKREEERDFASLAFTVWSGVRAGSGFWVQESSEMVFVHPGRTVYRRFRGRVWGCTRKTWEFGRRKNLNILSSSSSSSSPRPFRFKMKEEQKLSFLTFRRHKTLTSLSLSLSKLYSCATTETKIGSRRCFCVQRRVPNRNQRRRRWKRRGCVETFSQTSHELWSHQRGQKTTILWEQTRHFEAKTIHAEKVERAKAENRGAGDSG